MSTLRSAIGFFYGPPLKVDESVRLHNKSHQKRFKCQNFLRVWSFSGRTSKKKPVCFSNAWCRESSHYNLQDQHSFSENMSSFVQPSWIQTKNLSCGFMFDWKYEWLCPTFLESKPGVFQVVSCFIEIWVALPDISWIQTRSISCGFMFDWNPRHT